MDCELCGANAPLTLADVSGAKLKVCSKCLKFGKSLEQRPAFKKRETATVNPFKQAPSVKEFDELELVDDFSDKVKEKLKELDWSVEEFAGKLFEKKSVVVKVLNDDLPPEEKLVEKMQRLLKMRLKRSEEDPKAFNIGFNRKDKEVTLGDLVDFKKK